MSFPCHNSSCLKSNSGRSLKVKNEQICTFPYYVVITILHKINTNLCKTETERKKAKETIHKQPFQLSQFEFSKTNPQHRIYWHCGVFCQAFESLADSNNPL